MQWTPQSIKKHDRSLNEEQAKVAAKVANDMVNRTKNVKKSLIAGIMAAKNVRS